MVDKTKVKSTTEVYTYNCRGCGKENTRKVYPSQTRPIYCPQTRKGELWHNCAVMMRRRIKYGENI